MEVFLARDGGLSGKTLASLEIRQSTGIVVPIDNTGEAFVELFINRIFGMSVNQAQQYFRNNYLGVYNDITYISG